MVGQSLPIILGQKSDYPIPRDRDLNIAVDYSNSWLEYKNAPVTSSFWASTPISADWFLSSSFAADKMVVDDLYDLRLNLIYQIAVENSKLMFNVGPAYSRQQANSRIDAVNMNDPFLQYYVNNSVYSLAGVSFLNPFFFVSIQNTKAIDANLTEGNLSYLGDFKSFIGGTFVMADGVLVVMPSVEINLASTMMEDMKLNIGVSYQNQAVAFSYGLNGLWELNMSIYTSKYLQINIGYGQIITPGISSMIIGISSKIPPKKESR